MTGRLAASFVRSLVCVVLTSAALAAWPAGVARAHGDVHPRIDQLTAQIAAAQGDAALLAARGRLYALDEDWAAAAADFDAALQRDPATPDAERALADALLHMGQERRALALLDAVVARHAERGADRQDARELADAHRLRARAHARLGEREAALADFDRTVALEREPSPRDYLERARLLAGRDEDADLALAGLEEGVTRLGPIVTLVELAVELETSRNRWAAALSWIDRLPPAARDAPRWRGQRAACLRRLGQRTEALAEIDRALLAIDALPPSRRDSEATQAQRADLARERASLAAEGGNMLPWPLFTAVAVACAYFVYARRQKKIGRRDAEA